MFNVHASALCFVFLINLLVNYRRDRDEQRQGSERGLQMSGMRIERAEKMFVRYSHFPQGIGLQWSIDIEAKLEMENTSTVKSDLCTGESGVNRIFLYPGTPAPQHLRLEGYIPYITLYPYTMVAPPMTE